MVHPILVPPNHFRVPNDVLSYWGSNRDVVAVFRSTALGANTALSGVLLGTPESAATPANSLLISNTVADGDIVLYTVNAAGANSIEAYRLDASAGLQVWNEASADWDFRWEGANVANLLVMDGGNDNFGLGTAIDANRFINIIPPNRTGTHSGGLGLTFLSSTFTDSATAASGTVASAQYLHTQGPTLAATNLTVTITEAATQRYTSAPIEGTNVTITTAAVILINNGSVSPVNHYGLLIDGLTGGTTTNAQIALKTAAPTVAAVTDLVQFTARDFAVGDARLYVQSETGSAIIIGANAVRVGLAGTATGSFAASGATSGVVTVTVAAAAGTWTMTLPTAVGTAGFQLTDAAGDGITSWAGAGSRPEYKEFLPESEWLKPHDALATILATKVPAFHFKPGMGTGDVNTRYDGVRADWSPWATHYNGGILNPINALGYTILGFQAIDQRLQALEQRGER